MLRDTKKGSYSDLIANIYLYTLKGYVRIDDAYLAGEVTGGKAGHGSENKVPFIAAVALNPEGKSLYAKMSRLLTYGNRRIGGKEPQFRGAW